MRSGRGSGRPVPWWWTGTERRHLHWFTDHARLEPLLVDDATTVRDGCIQVNTAAAGHGMTISTRARPFQVS